ncbi:MAG TPA: NAD(P)H-binding protein, partial [Propionibacteriaceae bacterium]|nr:NAD(P)H-binding protein [Propionibacteriaceae bacterium]
MSRSRASDRQPVLVTGATGYIGGLLVPALLDQGRTVRVFTRSADRLRRQPWVESVEIAEGDATDITALAHALEGVGAAYYLLHSMDGQGDFSERDRTLAEAFASAAKQAGVGRIVYLSGLHPDGHLSTHLQSRVEVGEILLGSGVPTVVLQAGIVMGAGSASFDMLRHLTERLPAMIAPKWSRNRIQPIAIDDVLFDLTAALDLADDVNRTFDIGGPEVLTYAEMIKGYARVTGLGRRTVLSVPVLTPWLASHWVSVVTPVGSGIARPLVGSLVHEAVVKEDDFVGLVGAPPGGRTGFDESVRRATQGIDPTLWRRTARQIGIATLACAAAGSALTTPDSDWYRGLRKPFFQPPAVAFPVVWTALFAAIGIAA